MLPLLMPYEWFEKIKAGKEQHLLLLWLDEDAFGQQPLVKLNVLFSSLGTDASRVKLIGPYGSTVLKAMVKEANRQQTKSLHFKALQKVDVLSATATATDANLAEGGVGTSILNGKSGFHSFYRSISTDDKLMDLIIGELSKRILFSTKHAEFIDESSSGISTPDHHTLLPVIGDSNVRSLKTLQRHMDNTDYTIAIISEWDSLYGRSLPQAFGRAACNAMKKYKMQFDGKNKNYREVVAKVQKISSDITEPVLKNSTSENSVVLRPENKPVDMTCTDSEVHVFDSKYIKRFSYMRGIDGVLASPNVNQTVHHKRKADAEVNKNVSAAVVEQPEGRSQKDYLRRLAGQIYQADQDLRVKGKRGIRAIGVLGSDIYDKLLILQALRQRFSNAVFFTTDLDAILLHPNQFKWTRNLVVASAYGLHLGKDQENIPPFRDSYQTSVFHAVQIVLNDSSIQETEAAIYEVGRNKAFKFPFKNGANLKKMSRILMAIVLIFFLAILFWNKWFIRKRQRKFIRFKWLHSLLKGIGVYTSLLWFNMPKSIHFTRGKMAHKVVSTC